MLWLLSSYRLVTVVFLNANYLYDSERFLTDGARASHIGTSLTKLKTYFCPQIRKGAYVPDLLSDQANMTKLIPIRAGVLSSIGQLATWSFGEANARDYLHFSV